jgi:hypothetical protein
MLDHTILPVSNVERSLAFYEAALKPLNIKFFLPNKGEGDHPELWGFGDSKGAFFCKQGKPDTASIQFSGVSWPKITVRTMSFIRQRYPLVPGTIFHRGQEWNTILDTTPPKYLTLTDIRSRSSTKVSVRAVTLLMSTANWQCWSKRMVFG